MRNGILPSLAIVVPCYNEEDIFPICLESLSQILINLISQHKINKNSYILFVDDGSSDLTWSLVKKAVEKGGDKVKGIKLSKNQGHQIALLAGLSFINTDISISIDADLQDDINAIYKMIEEYYNGNDIVYGVRNDRSSDSRFKRTTATSYYKLMSIM